MAFYDFSKQLQTDDVTLVGGFDYEDFMIPELQFVGKDTLAAFRESATYYYENIADEPKVEKEVKFNEEIQSIFISDKYIGYVLDHLNSRRKEDIGSVCIQNPVGKNWIRHWI